MGAYEQERFRGLRLVALMLAMFVCVGLAENLLAPRGGAEVRLAVPAAIVFTVFAAQLAAIPSRAWVRWLASAMTLCCGAISALGLVQAPLAPRLDAIERMLDAAALNQLGFSGHMSLSLRLFGAFGAFALLAWRQMPMLAVIATLGLMLRTKIAVLELVLNGMMLEPDLSVWSVLCACSLEVGLILLLRRETLFACLFMRGRPGNIMRAMALATVVVPMFAGAVFLRFTGGATESMREIGVLCGLLGWGMMLLTLAFGHYLKSVIEQLEENGRRDPLTRLLNRHGLSEALRRARGAYRGVILCDLDRFKSINDRFGHEQGDRVLRGVAEALTTALAQEQALVARWGGEEFLILLDEESSVALREVAERCRNAVATMPDSVWPGRPGQGASASFGCALALPGERALEGAIQSADLSLYAAKVSGRNRVVMSPPREAMVDLL